MPGVLAPGELSALFARARAFLTASRYEGWPIAVAEAMASGVPVVGFGAPGVDELVRSGRDGMLVPAGDVEALAGALRTVVIDAGLAERLGRSGRARARAWPTWKDTARRFASEMESFAARSTRGIAQATGAP